MSFGFAANTGSGTNLFGNAPTSTTGSSLFGGAAGSAFGSNSGAGFAPASTSTIGSIFGNPGAAGLAAPASTASGSQSLFGNNTGIGPTTSTPAASGLGLGSLGGMTSGSIGSGSGSEPGAGLAPVSTSASERIFGSDPGAGIDPDSTSATYSISGNIDTAILASSVLQPSALNRLGTPSASTTPASTATLATGLGSLTSPAASIPSIPSGGSQLSGSGGLQLAGSSGLQLGGSSGLQLGGSSGIQLGGSSGLQLGGSGGLQLGGSASGSSGNQLPGFGALASASATPSTSAPIASGGFGLRPATSGLSLGAPAASTSAPTASTAAKSVGFGLGGSIAASAAPPASSAAGGGLKLTLSGTSTSNPSVASTTAGLTLPSYSKATAPTSTTAAPASTAATSGGWNPMGSLLPSTLTMGSAAATKAVATTAATAPTIAASSASGAAAAPTPKMSYKELEDQINKWSVELESQEKVFLEQATKVNAWDSILIENGRKITELNSDVETVKQDQLRLTSELDFITSQQNELEELLLPLEQAANKLPSISSHQHVDSEREHTYRMAENIDAQLKRMTEDLKELIDHLNATSGPQDSNDPLLAISKILNAHMDSLQWIDNNTAMLQQKTQAISLNADAMKVEHERNLRMAYN